MSLTILFIAACHAIPPVLGGVISKRKIGVIVGGIIGAVIGVASGSPAYMLFDLIGVGLGVWAGFSLLENMPDGN